MNEYTIYFEIYGKKMKTKVLANTKEEAKEIIRSKIIFHKIENESGFDIPEFLKNIFK